MKKLRKDNKKSIPPVNGTVECNRGHRWSVVDLNPERVNVSCPVCGGYTSIRIGFKNESGRK